MNALFPVNPASAQVRAVLHIRPADDAYHSTRRALETCERFLQSAALLPAGDLLGLRADFSSPESVRALVWSSPDAGVTPEDIAWMFRPCAGMEPAAPEAPRSAAPGRLYALVAPRGTAGDGSGAGQDDDDDDWEPGDSLLSSLLSLLREAGAAVTFAAGRAESAPGHGRILLALPEGVSLRVRSALTLAFPRIVLTEVSADTQCGCLPDGVFLSTMRAVLRALMDSSDENSAGDASAGQGGAGDAAPEEDPPDPDASIDDLNLSVRVYNALARSGIRSIRELQGMSDEDLLQECGLSVKCLDEVREKLAAYERETAPVPKRAPGGLGALNELVGLEAVKEQVRKIAAFARMKQAMAEAGRDTAGISLNMEFTGNPGTAKTTVARILAGILGEIGILPGGDLVEVGRADLVAEYVGQTAGKVRAAFRRAKGRVLFIDEAYSLLDDRSGTFGDEAINTIVQEMENCRGETVVIFAGYPDRMRSFFRRNPGLRSRVPFSIRFPDYSADELVQIAVREALRRGFSLDRGAMDAVSALCACAAGQPDAGNGRFCRNLVESAILDYASRVYGADGAPDSQGFTLTAADFSRPAVLEGRAPETRIGFCA